MKRFAGAFALLISSVAAGLSVLGCAASSDGVTSAVTSCHAGPEVVCLTRADGGRIVQARLGQEVGVVLSDVTLVWSNPEVVGPRLLRQTGSVTRSPSQLTGWYKAVGIGRTSLRATATPRCTAGQACPQFVLLWQVQLTIGQ